MQISNCGLDCNECPFYNNPCAGCYNITGKTFWAKEATSNGICPLFDCSINKRGFQNCGDCKELPCKKFMDLKDPNISEEEHKTSINKRVRILKSN